MQSFSGLFEHMAKRCHQHGGLSENLSKNCHSTIIIKFQFKFYAFLRNTATCNYAFLIESGIMLNFTVSSFLSFAVLDILVVVGQQNG